MGGERCLPARFLIAPREEFRRVPSSWLPNETLDAALGPVHPAAQEDALARPGPPCRTLPWAAAFRRAGHGVGGRELRLALVSVGHGR